MKILCVEVYLTFIYYSVRYKSVYLHYNTKRYKYGTENKGSFKRK